jgi:hypothetical protein
MIRFHLVATLFYFYTIAFSPNALTLYFSVMPLLLLPRTRWSRPHSFVERDSYSVHWVDLPVECRLEVSMRAHTVKTIALDLATCLPNSWLLRLFSCLRFLRHLFSTRSTQQATIRSGFAVWCDRESFATQLTILQLSRKRLSLLIHLTENIIVVRVVIII